MYLKTRARVFGSKKIPGTATPACKPLVLVFRALKKRGPAANILSTTLLKRFFAPWNQSAPRAPDPMWSSAGALELRSAASWLREERRRLKDQAGVWMQKSLVPSLRPWRRS